MVYITTEDMRFPLPEIGNRPETGVPPVSGGSCQPPVQPPVQLPADSINPALLALAMGFVPVQAWEEPYDDDLALARGTIFPALDKPFLGEEALPR